MALQNDLTSGQKASALAGYQSALDNINSALAAAQTLLDSSAGQVQDDATRQSLQTAITTATKTATEKAGITATDANTAQQVQAAIDNLNTAESSLVGRSAAVSASQAAWQAAKDAEAAAQESNSSSSSSSHSSGGSSSNHSSGGSSSSGSFGVRWKWRLRIGRVVWRRQLRLR